jgi:hypothetical protein
MKSKLEKFTPGPWLEYNSQGAKILNHWRIWDGKTSVCTLAACENPEMEHANARLIAAAPDLLAALERAMRDIENPEQVRPRSQHTLSLATRQWMRAAILKATEGK